MDCLQKIKEECNEIWNSNIYLISILRSLWDYKNLNLNKKPILIYSGKKLDEWVKIIKDTLEKFLTGVGKGSFNMNVASEEIYEYLKLKKYMTMVKCLMKDYLHNLVTKYMNNYIKFFQHFIPMKT